MDASTGRQRCEAAEATSQDQDNLHCLRLPIRCSAAAQQPHQHPQPTWQEESASLLPELPSFLSSGSDECQAAPALPGQCDVVSAASRRPSTSVAASAPQLQPHPCQFPERYGDEVDNSGSSLGALLAQKRLYPLDDAARAPQQEHPSSSSFSRAATFPSTTSSIDPLKQQYEILKVQQQMLQNRHDMLVLQQQMAMTGYRNASNISFDTAEARLTWARQLEAVWRLPPPGTAMANQPRTATKDGNTTKKKSALDDEVVKPPKRPLTAYNLFFQEERRRLLSSLPSSDTSSPADTRQGKKKHGKIGFEDLARVIGSRWREIGPEDKAYYQGLAAKEQARYAAEKDVYRQKKDRAAEKRAYLNSRGEESSPSQRK